MTASQTKSTELNYVIALGLACLALIAALPASALASDEPAAGAATTTTASASELGLSNRMSNKLGIYLGVGEPAPTLAGVNVAYNAFDFLRLSAGYGKLSMTTSASWGPDDTFVTQEASVTTIGMGARAFVPGWSLTPSVGLHFAHVSYEGQGLEIHGFEDSGSHVYGTAGVDYQSKSGFNASLGVVQSFKSGVGSGAYLTLGWFFNWLG